jgi:hypothetical protein
MPTYTFEYGKMRNQYGSELSVNTKMTHELFRELLNLESDQWIIHRVKFWTDSKLEEYYFDNHARIYIVSECNEIIQIGIPGEYSKTVKNYKDKYPIKFPPSRWRLSDEQIDVVKMISHHSEIATYMSMIMSKLI